MKRINIVLFAVILLLTVTACSSAKETAYITDIQISENGNLIYTMSDGKKTDIGALKGIDGEDGRDGKDGEDGRSIVASEINEEGDLIITYSDGTVVNTGRVVGEDGKDGKDGKNGRDGINGTDGKDGERGKDGADGKDGEDGADGKDGKDGADGKDAITPHMGENGNWWIGEEDTGVKAGTTDFIFNNQGKGTELIAYMGQSFHVVVPEKTTKIAFNALGSSTIPAGGNIGIIESLVIPGSVKEITVPLGGERLQSITLRPGIEYIDIDSFVGCTALEDVELPDTVHTVDMSGVGDGYRDRGPHNITIMAKTPPKLVPRDGRIPSYFKFYVPAESVETYRAAEIWSTCKDNIFPIPE